MKKLIITACSSLLVAGCSFVSQHDSNVRAAVSSRVFSYQAPQDGDAILSVTRDNGMFGGGCSSRLHIDDKFVAQLETGEQVQLHVPSGQHTLSLETSGSCGNQASSTPITLQAGQNQQVSIDHHGTSMVLAQR